MISKQKSTKYLIFGLVTLVIIGFIYIDTKDSDEYNSSEIVKPLYSNKAEKTISEPDRIKLYMNLRSIEIAKKEDNFSYIFDEINKMFESMPDAVCLCSTFRLDTTKYRKESALELFYDFPVTFYVNQGRQEAVRRLFIYFPENRSPKLYITGGDTGKDSDFRTDRRPVHPLPESRELFNFIQNLLL